MACPYDFDVNSELDIVGDGILRSERANGLLFCLETIFIRGHDDTRRMMEQAGGRFQPGDFGWKEADAVLAITQRFKSSSYFSNASCTLPAHSE